MFRLMVITLFLGVMVSTGMVSAAEKVPAGEEIQAAGQQETPPQRGVFLSRWLRMLDHGDPGEHGSTGVMAYASKVPGDMTRALQKSGGKRGLAGFVVVLALSLLSISVGYLVVYLARRAFRERISTLNDLEPAGNSSWSKLSVILLQLLPQVAGLFLLGLSSIIFFVPFANFLAATESRMIFQLILGIVLVTRFSTLLAWVVLGADQQSIPLLAVRETVAKPGRTLIWSSVFLLVTPLMIIRFFKELGVQQQTISWLSILLGTLVLFLIGCQLLAMRQPVAQAIRDDGGGQALPLVDYWHLPAVFYLLFCWFVWIGRELTGTALRNGALIASVLIVPFYFVLCYFGKSIIHSIIHSLNLFAEREPAAWERVPSKLETGEDEQAREEKIEELVAKVYSFFRILLAFTLFTWLLNLWGYTIPFAARALEAILESLVVLTLALVSWQYASSYIERKIKEATPEEPEDQENGDDEFGGAAPRGRSHTLLPMLRKVIGTVLMVMVVLIVISSFGVDIGPLLAGAGVVGLAVGFGAQKLVSDVFSGFFFLLDDAFRVGEYIQAGSTKGTVESITLRNVLLRHHLGMLQVVPHSDLGAITNYMRGGIVVRFPLEFTYYHPWYTIQLPAEIEPRFAKQLLLDGIYRCRYILKHPPPVVRLTDASTIPYTYMCWIYFPNYPAMFRGREELYREIHYVLQKAGISPAAATHEWRVRKSEIPVAEPPTIQLALKSQEIFTHLADDEIEEIACESQQIHYEAGAKIQYDTGEVDAFDIVISGVVEVSMELPSGKRISAGELKPGDSYGLVSMFTDNPQSSDWIAQTDVTLIRIDLASMKRLLKKHPHLTDRIASVVKQRQDEAESLRMQDVAEGGMSSLREIKTYIKQMLKRTKK